MSIITNVLGTALESCSLDPLTGFFRDGCCNTCADDIGQHTSCVEMTEEFLLYSRRRGNDLITPQLEIGFPGLLPGDRWCICLPRWIEAYNQGVVGRIHLRATHHAVADTMPMNILERCALHDA